MSSVSPFPWKLCVCVHVQQFSFVLPGCPHSKDEKGTAGDGGVADGEEGQPLLTAWFPLPVPAHWGPSYLSLRGAGDLCAAGPRAGPGGFVHGLILMELHSLPRGQETLQHL